MPNPSNNMHFEQWETCDRCGFPHPLSLLVKQKGLLLCTDHSCIDDLDNERREIMIGEVLAQGEEFTDQRGEIQTSPGEDVHF